MKPFLLAATAAALAFTATGASAAVVTRLPPPKISIPAPKAPNVETSEYDCKTEMGQLRLIRPAQFEVAAYDGIFVQPVCEGEEAGAAVRNAGNAGGLRPIIALKGDIVQALSEEDYVADEVVGVRFGGGNTLILYVHHYR